MVVFAVAIWHIWENRNNVRNGEAVPHPPRLIGKTKGYIDCILMNDFRSTTSTRRENQSSIQKWSPPPVGSMMMNVDASIFSKSGRMGYGIIIRDHLGSVQAASRGYVNHVDNPELAEALAVRHALNFAAQAGFENIMVASDCLSLIKKVKSIDQDRSHTGAVVHDIKCKALKFVMCSFDHVDRSCNEAAHVLAKSPEHDVGSC
jgi:ribonuclease HI